MPSAQLLMKSFLLTALALSLALPSHAAPASSSGISCTDLASTTAIQVPIPISNTTIISISTQEKRNTTIPATPPFLPSPIESLSICEVVLTYNHPNAPTPVKLTLFLPLHNWNGRLLGVGGSGFASGIPATMAPYAKLGYATASTDAGLPGGGDAASPGEWALLSSGEVDVELLENFAGRSVHDLAVLGKVVVERFYGEGAARAYWSGCSTGGRQGLMAAQRYPGDFDGIVGGAPAGYWAEYVVAEQWPQVVMREAGVFPEVCVLEFFAAEALEVCDALDGVVDKVIGDVEGCRSIFDPSALVGAEVPCEQGNIAIDVAAAEVVSRILEGPDWWYGLNPGTPLTLLANTTDTNTGRIGVPFFVNDAWIKYFLKQDPSYNTAQLRTKELEQLLHQSVSEYDRIIGTADPDLTAFRDHGGKLLVWHGLSDQLIFPNGSVKYFESVQEKLSTSSGWQDDDASVEDFFRLFLAPGVDHCAGGLTVGAAPVDPLSAVVDWVERGMAPDMLAAAFPGQLEPQRKLCPYPKRAVYAGIGLVDDLDSWVCE